MNTTILINCFRTHRVCPFDTTSFLTADFDAILALREKSPFVDARDRLQTQLDEAIIEKDEDYQDLAFNFGVTVTTAFHDLSSFQ